MGRRFARPTEGPRPGRAASRVGGWLDDQMDRLRAGDRSSVTVLDDDGEAV
ncbi:hypothetical protein [Streptomyces sp. NPDC057676]|uniref:hypothetical protein n=1 Tax=Streptomyces sp. NPDC057676 TaxID=3346205 RepID=UPI0036B9AA27